MTDKCVSMGTTGRGHWVAVHEGENHRLIGPLPTRAEANQIAAEESDRIGLHGMYRGIPSNR
jgi:hypothetical protein